MKFSALLVLSLVTVAEGAMTAGGMLSVGLLSMTVGTVGASGRGVKRGAGGNATNVVGQRRRMEDEAEMELDAEEVEAGDDEVEEAEAEVAVNGGGRNGGAQRRVVVLRPRERGRARVMNMRLRNVCLPPVNVQQNAAAAGALMHLFGDAVKTSTGSMHRGILRGLAGSPLLKFFQNRAVELELEKQRAAATEAVDTWLESEREKFYTAMNRMDVPEYIIDDHWETTDENAGFLGLGQYLRARRLRLLEQDLEDWEAYMRYAFDNPDEVCGPRMDQGGRDGGPGGGPGMGGAGIGGGGGLVV